MSRIRTIKPAFFRHTGLFDAEQETGLPLRIAFAGLWCCCDREGRFKWRPRELKLDVMPHDEVDFSRVLHALATRGYLVKYMHGSEAYGWVPSWRRHQFVNNKETASEIPSHEDKESIIQILIDASTTRENRVNHANPEMALREGEGKGKGKGVLEGEVKATSCNEFSLSPIPEKSRRKASINGVNGHAPSPNSAAWDAYSSAYEKRHGMEPERGKKNNSIIKSIVEEIGLENAILACGYFPCHPDALYTRQRHPLALLKRDAQRVLVDAKSALPMTAGRAASIDKTASNPFLPLLLEARERERLEAQDREAGNT